jgi:RNA polymerase sigma-70 factor (ECF subfamily)
MITLMQKSPQYRGEADLGVWVYRLTTNVCLNRLRAAQRRQAREACQEVAAWLSVPPATPFERVSSSATLMQALRQLDDLGQQVFIFAYLDGMSQEEIAQATGFSRKTVGKRLQIIEALFSCLPEET